MALQPESTVPKWLNRICLILSVAIVLHWLWKYLGPDAEATKRQVSEFLRGARFDMGALFSIGIAIAAGGYLAWRFLAWYFRRKYDR